MDPLIQPGQTLRMERGQAAVIVEERRKSITALLHRDIGFGNVRVDPGGTASGLRRSTSSCRTSATRRCSCSTPRPMTIDFGGVQGRIV